MLAVPGERRQCWEQALRLPAQPDLATSLVAELADYLALPVPEVRERCRSSAAVLAAAWQAAGPTTSDAIDAFYRQGHTYLYELTWWHALADDESALVQVVALEQALSHGASTALDFGSGIGSLGLLLASHGLAVTLAELNPQLQAYARHRFARRDLQAQFIAPELAALPSASYDLITAIDVLEHLPDPQLALARLAAALRPGGTLVVHAPDVPDPLRPMHLWHDPARLLADLPAVGLWLQATIAGALVLRRGEGPRYRLNDGLELHPSGALLSRSPLLAFRLSPPAQQMLAALDAPQSALELAVRCPQIGLPELVGFLDELSRRRLLLKTPGATRWPTVSVIVPAHGRPAQTRACVLALLALEYPGPAPEIIVVDDASVPPLAQTLADLPIRIIRHAQSCGPSAARNSGAAAAGGELLAFTDNDCAARPDWLKALVPYFDDSALGFVGGRVLGPAEGGPIMAFEAVRSPLDMGPNPGMVGIGERIAYMPSCNLLVRRALLARLGGFDPTMPIGEDVDLIWRGQRTGAQAFYTPGGAVVHHHRSQLGAFVRRRSFYARSEVDLLRRHPQSRRIMQLPITVLLGLAALAALAVAPAVGAALGGLLLLALLVELLGKRARLRRSGLRLPVAEVGLALLRGHLAALYHLGVNVLRYYSLPLLTVAALWPPLLVPLLVLALVPPLLDHRRLRPSIPAPRFVALLWVELTAYQLGIWAGCLRWRTLVPLLPRLWVGR